MKTHLSLLVLSLCLVYATAAETDPSWVEQLSKLTNYALDNVIHPTEDKELEVHICSVDWNNAESIRGSLLTEDTLHYLIGFLICIGISILLGLVVTLSGLIIFCCRCCCSGGKKKRKQKENGCASGCCGFFLFLFTSTVLFGCVCMFQMTFALNDTLKEPDTNVFSRLADSIGSVDEYTNSTLHELKAVTDTSFNSLRIVTTATLDGLVDGAFGAIDSNTSISNTLHELDEIAGSLVAISADLVKSFEVIVGINKTAEWLESNFTSLAPTIKSALLVNCSIPECQKAVDMIDTFAIAISYDVNADNAILLNNHSEQMQSYSTEAATSVEVISDIVELAVEKDVNVDDILNDVQQGINDLLKSADDMLAGYSLSGVANDVRKIPTSPEFKYWDYAYYGFLVLASLLAAIVLFYYLGLFHGVCCSVRKQGHGACCTKAAGSTCMLTALTVLFLTFWLMAFLCLLLFLTGGLVHTEVCRAARKPNESVIFSDVINMTLNTADQSLPIDVLNIYTKCGQNASLYEALNLANESEFNLDIILDLKVLKDKLSQIGDIDVNLGNIEFYGKEFKGLADSIKTTIDQLSPQLTNLQSDLQANVTSIDLGALAGLMRTIAENETSLANGNELAGYADQVAELAAVVSSMTKGNGVLAVKMNNHQTSLSDINNTIMHSVDTLIAAEDEINTNGDTIIDNFFSQQADALFAKLEIIVNGVKQAVIKDVGRCYPIYFTYHNSVDLACVTFLYPVNNLWFAMAWCLVFLLPTIPMAFKLVDLYRLPKRKRSQTQPYQAYEEPIIERRKLSHRDNTEPVYVLPPPPRYSREEVAMDMRDYTRHAPQYVVRPHGTRPNYPDEPPPHYGNNEHRW